VPDGTTRRPFARSTRSELATPTASGVASLPLIKRSAVEIPQALLETLGVADVLVISPVATGRATDRQLRPGAEPSPDRDSADIDVHVDPARSIPTIVYRYEPYGENKLNARGRTTMAAAPGLGR
jgi:hypothetical protein